MSGIFISYRRADAGGHAGRLFDRLRRHFGEKLVFRDVDDIREGDPFPDVIRQTLETCNVVLVIIGARWLDIADAKGGRRLDNPSDWVRIETRLALEGKARVIPVLVGGSSLPTADQLPEDLRSLVSRNAAVLDDPEWDDDVGRLIRTIETSIPIRHYRRYSRVAIATLSVALIAAVGYFGLSTPVPNFAGMTAQQARDTATRERLQVVREDRAPAKGPRGVVLEQSPQPGRRLGNVNLSFILSELEPVDLSKWVAILDQGAEGAGPAFAMATALNASLASQGRQVRVSPRYLYEKARTLDETIDPREEGAAPEYVNAVVQEYGAVPAERWPYVPNEKTRLSKAAWQSLDQEAGRLKATIREVTSLEEAHASLSSGHPVVAVIQGADTWARTGAQGRITATTSSDPAFRHVVVITAIDLLRDDVQFANSWGTGWGDRGFGHMSAATASTLLEFDQMWSVRALP